MKKISLLTSVLLIMLFSCKKNVEKQVTQEELQSVASQNKGHGHLQQTKTFSADVVIRWLNMQLDMLRVPLTGGATGSQAANRAMAYCGIAVYESVVPGMPAYQTLTGQLNGFPEMPPTEPGKAYHWAASANAALAEMNRRLFPGASPANKAQIDTLENTLQAGYAAEADAATLLRSIAFGKEVATRVFVWAAADGSGNVNAQYVPQPQFIGPGFWVQSLGAGNTLVTTPPNNPQATNPYAYQLRLITPDVTNGTTLEPPPAYSTNPASPFFAMVKDVYDKSQALTPADSAMALYHRDAPGYPGGGHFVAILSQVLVKAGSMLDVAALAYAKTGIASFDATTICFVNKYTYNLVRPINYIRTTLGHGSWNALFNTPGHPEFPSAHAVNSAAIATALTDVLGDNFQFTLNTYHYLTPSLPDRSYNSFHEMAKEMADSRVLAGIHYQASCDKGLWLGNKVGQNILGKVKFLKD
ncbi:MAG: vanadium-dependent haloperoxidase [Bacteroidetes bacterium]|nr:MAG: vanadium-dependent haloperoxidase [Bacteroidota bacterium]